MAFCSKCGSELPAGSATCPSCGAIIGGEATVPAVDIYDHTADYDAKDISENKVYALCAYAFDVLGIIICLLAAKDSPYAQFHAREATKITVATVIVAVLTSVLCWTCIVPVAGIVVLCILCVVKVIAFVQVCQGKAKEPWLVRSLTFLH